MFQPQMVTLVRRNAEHFMTGTAFLLANATTTDTSGYSVETVGTVGTVACRLLPFARQDSKQMVAMQEKGRTFYTLIVPHDAPLADGQRVAISGVTYEIVQVDIDRTDKADKQAMIVRFG